MLDGIDASSYQGYVDWGQVRQSGHIFGFVKATEGTYYQDPTFPHNWVSLAYRGMVRGAYHFLRPSIEAMLQADYFHEYVRANGRFVAGDFVVCDVEVTDNYPPNAVFESLISFVMRCKVQIAKRVIVYTYPDFWINTLGDPTSHFLDDCPLWLADYGPSVPALKQWPNGLSFWQYSSTGHVPGVPVPCDLNRFYGDVKQLQQIARFP